MDDHHLNYITKLEEKQKTKHQCRVHTCEFHFQFVQNTHIHIIHVEREGHIYTLYVGCVYTCMSVVYVYAYTQI